MPSPLLGLRTAIYAAPNLDQTKAWYTAFLGIQPYFDEPFYVGYNIGGYELGLDPHATPAKGTPITYWGVSDIRATWDLLLNKGAAPQQEPQDVGGDILVATVNDPFGNTIGIIQNPHFSTK